ncbi:MAG: hypothetical protein H6Q58_1116 [Firmicutes bacterium]|nr:hypothetical protein [Bacillota bacterium]
MDILIYTLKSAAYALTGPYWAFQLAVLAFILHRKNVKTAAIQKMVMGQSLDKPFVLTISQVVIGIFAGTAASIIMSYLGIVFDETSMVDLIFLATVLFLFYNPRFVSIAYSGAVLCIFSLLLGYAADSAQNPAFNILKLDVAAVMTMVAVILFVEGILIVLDGRRGSVPVFANKEGRVMGGFILQRYWTVPVTLIIMLHDPALAISQSSVPMPQWWPMVKSSIPAEVLVNAVLMIIPFYGLMGFNSITFTMNRRRKTVETGVFKIVYSLALFGFARLAFGNPSAEAALPLAALAIHEGWIFYERKRELAGKPKYISGDEGVMVLEVMPESVGAEMGIRSGDLLTSINGIRIEDEKMLMENLSQSTNFIWIGIKREDGSLEQISYDKMFRGRQLGLLLVPKGVPEDNLVIKFDDSALKKAMDKIKNRENDI